MAILQPISAELLVNAAEFRRVAKGLLQRRFAAHQPCCGGGLDVVHHASADHAIILADHAIIG